MNRPRAAVAKERIFNCDIIAVFGLDKVIFVTIAINGAGAIDADVVSVLQVQKWSAFINRYAIGGFDDGAGGQVDAGV